MRLFVVFVVICAVLTSCGTAEQIDRLAYQNNGLTIEADFTIDGEVIPAKLQLEAPEYDESGMMLARDALLVISENSIISGVSFEAADGEMYVSSGVLRIPLSDSEAVQGIKSIISLFCISEECFYSAEEVSEDGRECELAVYINGDNRVELLWEIETGLPIRISAVINDNELTAKIHSITTTTTPEI